MGDVKKIHTSHITINSSKSAAKRLLEKKTRPQNVKTLAASNATKMGSHKKVEGGKAEQTKYNQNQTVNLFDKTPNAFTFILFFISAV